MSSAYTISLLPGNHGVWVLVSKNNQVIFEQAGCKTIAEALKHARQYIEYEEKRN